MRRALLVTVGTVAGLASVLSYSDGATSVATELAASGSAEGLGAPAPESTEPAAGSTPSASASTPAKPKPAATTKAKPSAKPAAQPTKAAAPAPTKAGAPAPAPKPSTTKAAPKPAPKPTPTKPALPSGDFVGSAVSHKYGTVQVGIRVKDGKIIKAWAAKYPTGESAPYSEFAIPTLASETVGATSASVARVSGATLTSKAWVSSLASAMSKAGI